MAEEPVALSLGMLALAVGCTGGATGKATSDDGGVNATSDAPASDGTPEASEDSAREAGQPDGGGIAPAISLLRPASAQTSYFDVASGATSSSNNLVVHGTSSSPSSTITVYLGDVLQGTASTDSSGNWTYALGPLADAAYKLTATLTSGGQVSPASSTFGFSVATSITGFTNVVNSLFDVERTSWRVETAGAQGSPGPSYALTQPDSHTLRFECRSGDKAWFDVQNGETDDRDQLDNTPGLLIQDGQHMHLTFEFMMEAGPANSATGWFMIYEFQSTHTSPPLALEFNDGSKNMSAPGDHLQIYSQYWIASSGAIGNANSVFQQLYVAPQPITRAHWHTMEWDVIPSTVDTGNMGQALIWLDGAQIVNYHGNVGNGSSDQYSNVLGVYRGNTPITETQSVQFRNYQQRVL
jgi:hypothetical protein